jgi:4'-phosphopantetheinyl transferase
MQRLIHAAPGAIHVLLAYHADAERPSVLARAAFRRRTLGAALGVSPDTLRYRLEEHGRPCLDPVPLPGFAFNCSSTRGRLGIALGAAGPVGFDVERHDPGALTPAMLDEVLHPRERERFECERDRTRALFDLWCCKEAALKAAGVGLLWPPKDVCVSAPDADGWSSATTPGSVVWRVRLVDAGAGCSAAVAAVRAGPLIVAWDAGVSRLAG